MEEIWPVTSLWNRTTWDWTSVTCSSTRLTVPSSSCTAHSSTNPAATPPSTQGHFFRKGRGRRASSSARYRPTMASMARSSRSVSSSGARFSAPGPGSVSPGSGSSSTPSRAPTLTPKSLLRVTSLSTSGMVVSLSHLEMAWRETPRASPSASWDRPFCRRSS